MKPLTEELIKQHLGSKFEKKGDLQWDVTLPLSGVVVELCESGIQWQPGKYYRLFFFRRQDGIDEVAFEQDIAEVVRFGKEVWGDTRLFFDMPEKYGWSLCDPDRRLREYFGDAAVAKKCWLKATRWPAWKISQPDGSFVRYGGGALEEVCGDEKLREAAIRYLNEVEGSVRVCGTPVHLHTCVALVQRLNIEQGLNIEIIPELIPERLCNIIGLAAGVPGFLLPLIWLPMEQALVIGVIWALFVVPIIMMLTLSGWLNKKAVLGGMKYRSQLPPVHGGSRAADHDEAQRKGWIL